MAKKRKNAADIGTDAVEASSDTAAMERLEAEITKEFGDGTFISGSNLMNVHRQVIPVSPALNLAMNGGIPEGCWVICSGKPKSGKTSLSLAFAAKCQRPEFGGRNVYYMDVEARLKHMNLVGTFGLNLDKFFVIKSVKGKQLTAENYLNTAIRLLSDDPGCLLILDSTSALCPEKELIAESVDGQTRSGVPKLMASFCRKANSLVPTNGCILWAMQHLIANTGGTGGPTFMEDGGNKIWYQADVKLRVKWFEQWKVGDSDTGKPIGQKIHWNVVTSALGGIPNTDVEGYLRYGLGIDDVYETMMLALNLGVITASGSWLAFGENKVQGKEKMYGLLTQTPELYASLCDQLNTTFGTKLV